MGLVETKKIGCTDQFVRMIWGSDDVNWEEVKCQERSGGILCLWDKNFMTRERVVKGGGWLCIKGGLQEIRMEVAIIVAYGYHDNVNKSRLWQDVSCQTIMVELVDRCKYWTSV